MEKAISGAPSVRQGERVAGSYYAQTSQMPIELVRRLEELAFQYGRSYDSYLVTEPYWSCFFTADHSGAICFVRWFGYHSVGGLLCDEGAKPALLDSFLDFCSSRRQRPLLYNVAESDIPLLRSRGFELTKWGEDPIVQLRNADWRGRKFEWVRRQENYCLRHGLKFREVRIGREDDWPMIRREIESLSASHIRRTANGREMGVFVGTLNLDSVNRRRLFVAESKDRLEGLVICNPSHGGRRWSFEMFRHSDTAPRGTIPFMFMQIMRSMAQEGIDEVSLSLIPALNCHNQPEGNSRLFAALLRLWWERFNWVFDLRGIFHFKSRFRPEYEPRYIAARPHFGLLQSYAFAAIWGVLEPNPLALSRSIARHWRNRRTRTTLAKPD